MRFVHARDGQLSLTKNFQDNFPEDAILSHTWGEEGDDVTFEDLMSDRAKDKKGYKKLLFCAEQAAADGLQHFWVDTCCIDQRSSLEVSRSINSMFRWYQRATKCYVYLSDVSATQGGGNSQSTWESAF